MRRLLRDSNFLSQFYSSAIYPNYHLPPFHHLFRFPFTSFIILHLHSSPFSLSLSVSVSYSLSHSFSSTVTYLPISNCLSVYTKSLNFRKNVPLFHTYFLCLTCTHNRSSKNPVILKSAFLVSYNILKSTYLF